jgi:hypothetical protein
MPQSPTAPEGRNPPTSIWPPAVGMRRMSRSCTRRRNWKFLVRANTTKDATEIAQ